MEKPEISQSFLKDQQQQRQHDSRMPYYQQQKQLQMEQQQQPPQCKRPRLDTNAMPTREYLDQTIAPILLNGLQTLARERPSDPVGFLAAYLLQYKKQCEESIPEQFIHM